MLREAVLREAVLREANIDRETIREATSPRLTNHLQTGTARREDRLRKEAFQ
ncbi:hypothetical protein D3C87_2133090 [compost metagenome]